MRANKEEVADLLLRLRGQGVTVWSEGGLLRYQAPAGTLARNDLDRLRALKAEIAAYLEGLPDDTSRIPSRAATDRVPLTSAQKWLWNFSTPETCSYRVCFSAMRISGPLNLEALRRSLYAVVCGHESLRTRIVTVDGLPSQIVDAPHERELKIVDLNGHEAAAADYIMNLVREPVHLSEGPLFDHQLLKLSNNDHILVVLLDHLISDGVSQRLVCTDLWSAYSQEDPRLLADRQPQFADYAVWQHNTQTTWRATHGSYWDTRLMGAKRVHAFQVAPGRTLRTGRYRECSTTFTGSVVSALTEVCRKERTILPMALLSAYAALLMRWCSVTDVVIPFITSGRMMRQLETVVGCFACPLFLRVELSPADSFQDLLKRVASEYGRACAHYDFGWLASLTPPPPFARNGPFNWLPEELEVAVKNIPGKGPEQIRVTPFEIEFCADDNPWTDQWDVEPALTMVKREQDVFCRVVYSADRAEAADVQRFCRNLDFFAESLAYRPAGRISEILCIP